MRFLLLVLLSYVYSYHTDFYMEESNNSLIKYITFIYNFYSKDYEGYVGVVDNLDNTYILTEFLKYVHGKEQNTVLRVNFNNENATISANDQSTLLNIYMGYLTLLYIFVNKCEELIIVLELMEKLPLYQTRCRVITVVEDIPNKQQLKMVFNDFYYRYFLNVIMVFEQDNFTRVYTYNPFWDADNFLEDLSNNSYTANVYYDKLKNLNGYPLKLLILKDDDLTKVRVYKNNKTDEVTYGGTDVILVKYLVNSLNGTLQVLNSANFLKPGERNPWRQTNELSLNLVGAKKRIITQQRVDLLNSEEMVLNKDLADITESLYPHDKDDLMIIMLKGEKIPYYRYLFMVFTFKLWCIFISAFAVIILFRFIFIHFSLKSWKITCINLFRVTITGSLPNLPNIDSERIFIVFWIIYSLIVTTAFQSILTSILMKVKYYPDLRNLHELDESGLKVHAFGTIINELNKSFTGTSKSSLIEKMIQMPTTFDHANNSQNNFYSLSIFEQPAVLNYNRASFYTRVVLFYKDGRSLLHVIRESILPRYLAFQVPVGSPFLNRLNHLLRRIQESGLLIIWRKTIDHQDVINKVLVPEEYTEKNAEQLLHSLSIFHLQTAFFILLLGLSLAGSVLLLEIFKFHL